MKLEKGYLRIYYNEGDLNQELDKALEEALKPFGYNFLGSGMSRDWTRDIELGKEKQNAPKCEPSTPVAIFCKKTAKPAMMTVTCLDCGAKMKAAKADGKWYHFHPFVYGKDKKKEQP